MVDVAHDAEKVSCVDTIGKGAALELGFEDGDAGHDGVEGIARDSQADVPLGVEQLEFGKSVIEEGGYVGTVACLERLPRQLLTTAAFFEGVVCFGDLFGGGFDRVELCS